jgi:hypothetical protein
MADEAFRWLTTLWQNTTKHGKSDAAMPCGRHRGRGTLIRCAVSAI